MSGAAGRCRWARVVPGVLVALAVTFNLAAFRSELTVDAPELNDHVFHLAIAERMSAAWEAGQNPRDVWIPYWGQGFPVPRYYQHGAHLVVVGIFELLGRRVPLETVFDGVRLLLLLLVPLTFYTGARWLGASRLAAGLAALCMPLLAVDPDERYLLGFQMTSFTWYGAGLFPQLAGLVLFPMALGSAYRWISRGRRLGPALLLLAGTWLCHLLLGFMACLLGLLLVLRPEVRGRRMRALWRLGGLYLATACVVAYQIGPALLEGEYLNRSVWESDEYWGSLGAGRILGLLVRGGLMDGGHVPVLTGLAILGLAMGALFGRRAGWGAARFAAVAFVAGLLLYFGRPTWGALLDAVPLGGRLPWHRLICVVQYAGLLLVGVALAALWRRLGWDRSRSGLAAAAILTGALLGPPTLTRGQDIARGRQFQRDAQAAHQAVGPEVAAVMEQFRELDDSPPARGYGGTSWDWGEGFRPAGAPVYTFWSMHGLPAISYMFHTMSLSSDLEVAFDPGRLDHAALFNVRHWIAPSRSRIPPFAQRLADRDHLIAAEVPTPGYFDVVRVPYFFSPDTGQNELFSFNQRFIEGPWHGQGVFVRIGLPAGSRPAAGQDVITGAAELPMEVDALPVPPGRVLATWGQPDALRARVEVDEAAHVLVRVTFHPGWKARVDGRPTEIVMLSPSYVGIPVDPGRHAIELDYRPGPATSLLFFGGVLLVGLAFLADRLRVWAGAREARRPSPRRVIVEVLVVVAVAAILIAVSGAPLA